MVKEIRLCSHHRISYICLKNKVDLYEQAQKVLEYIVQQIMQAVEQSIHYDLSLVKNSTLNYIHVCIYICVGLYEGMYVYREGSGRIYSRL